LPVAGSQAAIQLLPRLRVPARSACCRLCYAEHAEAWRRAGYVVREVLEQEVDFFLDSLDVLVVVNPTTPPAEPDPAAPAGLARAAGPARWLAGGGRSVHGQHPALSLAGHAHQVGLIVLRSFGKFFGLAGVRLGFVWPSAGCSSCWPNRSGRGRSAVRRGCGACLRDTAGQRGNVRVASRPVNAGMPC
jgi:cobalamin biosynthetic protein CobC